MKEIFNKNGLSVISRISWYWKDLVFSFDSLDPAFLFTVIQTLTFGNIYFREYAHYTYAKYISCSPVWVSRITEHNLAPEDICSAYGLFGLPYLYAYSFGYRDFNFVNMYDVEKMRPYIIKYVHRLFQRHNFRISWIFINYKYIGNINPRTIKVFKKDFRRLQKLTGIVYFAWKSYLQERNLWHETIL